MPHDFVALYHISPLSFSLALFSRPGRAAEDPEAVVLADGPSRATRFMTLLKGRLAGAGHTIVNLSRPSRKEQIEAPVEVLQKKLQAGFSFHLIAGRYPVPGLH